MTSQNDKLQLQQCSDIPADFSALNQAETVQFLQQLNGAWPLSPPWQLNADSQTISNTYSFKNYYQTMAFINVVAQISHQQDHHPDLLVSYNHCTITYSTHSVAGLSVKDFICAAKINASQVL